MSDEDLDRELSALLDGELTPQRARQLREEIEADPRLRERLAAFEAMDARLRALPKPSLPAELGARLQVRIGQRERQSAAATARPKVSIPRWGVPLAAALAAGLVAAWLMQLASDSNESDRPEPLQVQVDSDDSSDEEIAIALEIATLRDLDLIQELDLLEALLAMETTEDGPG